MYVAIEESKHLVMKMASCEDFKQDMQLLRILNKLCSYWHLVMKMTTCEEY